MVGRGGFEPPKSKTSDLQSDPFGRSGICPNYEILRGALGSICAVRKSVAATRLARTTTAILATPKLGQNNFSQMRIIVLWCLGAESNHRQADFQSAALPTELPGHI